MPTYEFRCPAGHEFERFFQRISDAPGEVPCAECEQTAERLISGGAGLVFKGSGFYITDYGKDGKKDQRERARSTSGKSGKESSGADSGGGGGGGAASDSAGNSSGGGKADGAKPAAAPSGGTKASGKGSDGGSSAPPSGGSSSSTGG